VRQRLELEGAWHAPCPHDNIVVGVFASGYALMRYVWKLKQHAVEFVFGLPSPDLQLGNLLSQFAQCGQLLRRPLPHASQFLALTIVPCTQVLEFPQQCSVQLVGFDNRG